MRIWFMRLPCELGLGLNGAGPVRADFEVPVGLHPAPSHQVAVNLAAQTQAKNRLQPHQGQADQADRQR